jgi:hypothetical protein
MEWLGEALAKTHVDVHDEVAGLDRPRGKKRAEQELVAAGRMLHHTQELDQLPNAGI